MLKKSIIIQIISLICFGCQAQQTNNVVVESTSENPYPGISENTNILNKPSEPYPGPGDLEYLPPEPPTIPKLIIPTPTGKYGIITGKLVTIADGEEAPYIGTLYLGSTIQANQPGFPPLISYSEQSSPKAAQDETGQFIFIDVPPGEYAILLWSPGGNIILEDPSTKQSKLINVNGGEIYDLETIVIP